MGDALALTVGTSSPVDDACFHQCEARSQAARLEETVQRLRGFNRSVAHDLRDPLGAVSGVLRLVMDAVVRSDAPSALRLLSSTVRHTESLTRLVAALLSLAEDDEAGEDVVDLGEVAREALAQWQLSRTARGANVPQVVIGVLPCVRGSAGLLRQVFVNLMGNAMKFTQASAEPLIEIGARTVGTETVMFVRDNGVGFAPEAAQMLFRPFVRLHGEDYEGSGLGLSIVRRIVERHGGRVWATAAPGQGAVFHFTLGTEAAASRSVE